MKLLLSSSLILALSLTVGCGKKDEEKKAPKTEAPKTEAPKTEAPKTETPKTEAPKTAALPAAAVVVSHQVKDYDTWKKAFDDGEADRKAAGALGHHLSRGVDGNENIVTVYVMGSDMAGTKAFVGSPKMGEDMKKAGVMGPPTIAFMTPVEDTTVHDKPLAGLIIMHEVADFDAWKKAYDEHAEARTKGGILGGAVNRDADKPNLVTVYAQAETVDELKKFTEMPELAEAMKKAGVKGKPTFIFSQGVERKMY